MALPTVNATHVHVVNLDTDEVYYTKGSGTVLPASLGKLLNARVVRISKPTSANLDESVTIVAGDLTAGGTGANLSAGDVLTIRQLLMNALLPSSNNSCMALARVIGQEFLDIESGGVGDPIARFMTEMDTVGTALGITVSIWIDPHGNNTTGESTPEEVNLIWPALRNDTEINRIWMWNSYVIDPSTGANKTITYTSLLANDPGIFASKTGSQSSVSIYNLSSLWEAPNGQVIAVTVMGCNTTGARYTDARAIIAQLLVDYPSLAVCGTPWTPTELFSALSCGGGWWDASDLSTLWQDTGATSAVAANNDPVARWNVKAGTAGTYWRQSTSGARPLWKSATNSLNLDGTDDYLDIGGTSVGGTGLFASGANEWMVYVKLKTTDTVGAILARAVATSTSRTFYLFIDSGGSQTPGLNIRGNTDGYSDSANSGAEYACGSFRDGADVAFAGETVGNVFRTTGAISENTTENIFLGARTEASPTTFLAGDIYQVVIADKYSADQFFRLRNWMAGNDVNAFSDPTGGVAPSMVFRRAFPMSILNF